MGPQMCLQEHMHPRFWVWVGLYFISSAFADSAETPKITEVVVYGDRARISREITMNVRGEDSQFELAGLPGDLDENSVGIAVRSGGSVIIRGMDVQREFLSENADARSLDQLPELEPKYLRFPQPLPGSAPRSMAFKSERPLPSATPPAKEEATEQDNVAQIESAQLESNGLSVAYQVAVPATIPPDEQANRTNL